MFYKVHKPVFIFFQGIRTKTDAKRFITLKMFEF